MRSSKSTDEPKSDTCNCISGSEKKLKVHYSLYTTPSLIFNILICIYQSIFETFSKKDSRNTWQCQSLEHCSPTIDKKETGAERGQEQKRKPVLQRGRSRSFMSLTENIKGCNSCIVK